MHQFFEKYPQEFNEMTAIKSIHKRIEKCQKMLKDHKNSPEYLKELAIVRDMIDTFFAEKGVNPAILLQQ